ncbi:MAG: cytochrome c oxidase assembly protein [Actinomycetota bacterium]
MIATAPWAFHPHPDVWLLVAALGGGYLWAVRGGRATRAQRRWFLAGVALLWAGADWPVHDVAEGSLYSVHMIQHMAFTLAAAPMMLLGTPDWLFRRLLRPRPVYAVVRAVSRPLTAIVVFNAVLVFTHWPLMVSSSVGSEPVHFGLHVLLMASAFAMWMPVVSPVLEIPRLSYPGQMLYLFLQSLVPTVPASFLTFGTRPLYHVYEAMPRLWGISPLTDQRTAGLIMKIVGGFVLWGIIAALFFRWYRVEQTEGVDVLAFRNVDRDLNRGVSR